MRTENKVSIQLTHHPLLSQLFLQVDLVSKPQNPDNRAKSKLYHKRERERECLVAGLVAYDDEDGAVAVYDAIFDQGSDALINFLPLSLSGLFLPMLRVRVNVPFSSSQIAVSY